MENMIIHCKPKIRCFKVFFLFYEISKCLEHPSIIFKEIEIMDELSANIDTWSIPKLKRFVEMDIGYDIVFELLVNDSQHIGNIRILRVYFLILCQYFASLSIFSEFIITLRKYFENGFISRFFFEQFFRERNCNRIEFIMVPRSDEISIFE